MRLKTFRAQSMADALALVKKDLGKDAVILHTRTLKIGGFLGFFGRTVIEITASDQANVLSRARTGSPPPPGRPAAAVPDPSTLASALATPGALGAYKRAATFEPSQPAPAEPPPELIPVRERRGATAPPPAAEPSVAAEPALLPVAPATIHKELADIKLLVNQVLQASPVSGMSAGGAGTMPDALFRHYLRLLEASVSREIADGIVGAVRDELNPGELTDESIVRATVLRHLAAMIPVADASACPATDRADGRPLTIALIGPTGVGKTTTIAKLAAAYKLRHGKSVGLITSDTYRIAAVDQLRTYAGIIGLPLRVVLTPGEMASAVEALADYDVILIDTAGRSQNAADRIEELADFLDAAQPHETHLVLSSTAAEAVLLRTAEAFAAAKPNRVILTKLDEAVNFGVVVNVARRLTARLSFVTTGQEVPDHIEPGRSDRLARLILDNSFAPTSTAPPVRTNRPQREPAPETVTSAGGGRAGA